MTFKNYNKAQFVSNVFTEQECDRIISLCKTNKLESGTVYDGDGGQIVASGARVAENWVFPENGHPVYEWIRQRIYDASRKINQEFYEFDLECTEPDRLAFVRYPKGGFFAPHTDNPIAPGVPFKKLTCVIQLSDSKSYQGGELRISQTHEEIPKDRGTMIVFPSYIRHRVDEVTKGERYILVNWCHSDTHFR